MDLLNNLFLSKSSSIGFSIIVLILSHNKEQIKTEIMQIKKCIDRENKVPFMLNGKYLQ